MYESRTDQELGVFRDLVFRRLATRLGEKLRLAHREHCTWTPPLCKTRWFLAQKPRDVVVGDGDHENDNEHDTKGIEKLKRELGRRTAHQGLDPEEHQASAVERRYRDEIDDGEVDGDKGGTCQDVANAVFGRISDHADKTDGTDDLGERRHACQSSLHNNPQTTQDGYERLSRRRERLHYCISPRQWLRTYENNPYAKSRTSRGLGNNSVSRNDVGAPRFLCV